MQTSHTKIPDDSANLSRFRRRGILFLFVVLVGGHIFMMLKARERWPLSDYHMYSGIIDPQRHYLLIVGDLPSGERIDLTRDGFWPPFEAIRLTYGLERWWRTAHEGDAAAQTQLTAAMPTLAPLYRGPTVMRFGLCQGTLDVSDVSAATARLTACMPIEGTWVEGAPP